MVVSFGDKQKQRSYFNHPSPDIGGTSRKSHFFQDCCLKERYNSPLLLGSLTAYIEPLYQLHMRLLATASSICLASLTRNRRIPFYGSPSTPTIRRHKFTQWTSNILHYPPFQCLLLPFPQNKCILCKMYSSLQMFIVRVAGCGQTAFPRVLDNSLGYFSSQEWIPSSPFASPSSVISAATCTSVWVERCIAPRDTVFKNSIYILCSMLHVLDHIHRFSSAPSYFGFL